MAMTMGPMTQGSKGIGMPITQLATSVVNGQVDRRAFYSRFRNEEDTPFAKGSEACYGVAKHELVFTTSNDKGRILSAGVNDPACSVFSSVNGLKLDKNASTLFDEYKESRAPQARARLEQAIARKIKFVGMCNTMQTDPNSHLSSHVSITVGGLVTIHNTGNHTMNIGDKIAWTLPSFSSYDDGCVVPKGTPPDKLLLRTVPAHKLLDDYNLKHVLDDGMNVQDGIVKDEFDALFSAIQTDKTKVSLAKHLPRFFDVISEYQRAVDYQLIGVCLKRAAPGEPMDVLLRAK